MLDKYILSKLRFREDTAENWKTANPILDSSEPGFENDTGLLKIGDGKTRWNSLLYVNLANNAVQEVLADGKLYLRVRDEDTPTGRWIELPVKEAPEDGTYIRNGITKTWEKFIPSEKANVVYRDVFTKLDNTSDKIRIKNGNCLKLFENTSTKELVLKVASDGKTLMVLYTPISSKIFISSGLEDAEYVELDAVYTAGRWANVETDDYTFDAGEQILTFKGDYQIESYDEDLVNFIEVKAVQTIDLSDVYNALQNGGIIQEVPNTKTLEDLFKFQYNKELNMGYNYISYKGISEPVFGTKFHYEGDAGINVIFAQNIKRVLQSNNINLTMNENNDLTVTIDDTGIVDFWVLYTK